MAGNSKVISVGLVARRKAGKPRFFQKNAKLDMKNTIKFYRLSQIAKEVIDSCKYQLPSKIRFFATLPTGQPIALPQ